MKKIGLMSAVLMSSAAMAADGIKLGGFADVGFSWTKTSGTDATKGFAVTDAALYFGKTVGMGEVFVDLPFMTNAAPTNALVVGTGKAQAWVSWKYDNGFWWKLGQFDYILGYEATDTWDAFFSIKSGAAFDVPLTHTGALIGYKASDALNVSFLVADPAPFAGTDPASKMDFGAKVDLTSDAYNLAAGVVMTADVVGAAASGDYGYLVNVIAGTKMGMTNAALEFSLGKAGADGAATALGFGGHFDHELSEMTALGASVEWMKDAAGAKMIGVRVGPKFMMNKDFNLRLAYGFDKPTGGTAVNVLAVNAVHQF